MHLPNKIHIFIWLPRMLMTRVFKCNKCVRGLDTEDFPATHVVVMIYPTFF